MVTQEWIKYIILTCQTRISHPCCYKTTSLQLQDSYLGTVCYAQSKIEVRSKHVNRCMKESSIFPCLSSLRSTQLISGPITYNFVIKSHNSTINDSIDSHFCLPLIGQFPHFEASDWSKILTTHQTSHLWNHQGLNLPFFADDESENQPWIRTFWWSGYF